MKPALLVDIWLSRQANGPIEYCARELAASGFFAHNDDKDEAYQWCLRRMLVEGNTDYPLAECEDRWSKLSTTWLMEEPMGTPTSKIETVDIFRKYLKAKTISYFNDDGSPISEWAAPGVELIPTISCEGLESESFKAVDIFEYEVSDYYRPYVDYLVEHIDEFKRVLIGYWNTECGAYDRWVRGIRYLEVYQRMESDPMYSINLMIEELERMKVLFPAVFAAGKAAVMANDIPFASEAALYSGRLDEAPLLSWCKENNVLVILSRGFWVLAQTPEEHRAVEHNPSPVMNTGHAGAYPYAYFHDYIKEHTFWSGLGKMYGATHNFGQRLLDWGFEDVYTYMPKVYNGEDEEFKLRQLMSC